LNAYQERRERRMNRKNVWIMIVGAVLVLAGPALAQFKPDEVAEWPKWEEFLKSANITASEQIISRDAVTKPYKLTLEKDGVVRNGLWKNIDNRRPGEYFDSWMYEIAAYRMDRLLGLDMVAPTVERRFKEERGSLQLWVDSIMDLKKKEEDKVKTPSYKIYPWNLTTYLQRAFDNLIGNEDRTTNNVLITKDWGMYLIDHSRTFRTSKKFTDQLIFRKGGKDGDKLMLMLPRTFVEKLKRLDSASIHEALGEYLNDGEISAVLKRRDLILKEVERLIKENGEDKTLY
jgi:hypothetical protein